MPFRVAILAAGVIVSVAAASQTEQDLVTRARAIHERVITLGGNLLRVWSDVERVAQAIRAGG